MTLMKIPSFNTKCPFHVFVAGAAASAILIGSLSLLLSSSSRIRRYNVDTRFTETTSYGGLVFICGQVGEGPTVIEQTASALKSVDDALALAGTDKSKILEATVWLSDMKYYDQFNSIYDKWVVPGKPPCRACLESKLASPKYLVEVRVIAAK